MSFTTFGRFELAAVHSGTFRLDGGAMFGVVPRNLWQKSNPPDEKNRIDMRMRTLLIRDGDQLILIDTGVGKKNHPKFQDIFAIEFARYSLADQLQLLGIAPEEVTDVILTHLHFDHAGGAVIQQGGSLALQFPNATHYVQKEQWEWALNPSERDRASYFPENYQPIADASRLEILDGETELFPDLHLKIVHGHTFGQQLVRLVDGDQAILYGGDLFPMVSHIPEPWIMGYDLQPLVTLREKQQILAEAVENRDIIFFEHDAEADAALVVKDEKGFRAGEPGPLADVVSMAGK
ncbi:MAG: MBL fold metallo-hydrolase [Ignavibacteria bacterium]|nr:MAG: MBL fold metallo-hydrolase [Ignavibacteria bacterium]